ncbi:unnamed protein product [Rodentolepis nana]|uniref:Reverse transcriptase domain-containing protein n=1 Tax=Rodentolepis nana TaxID=102285 RepID=A0A0R3T494_RODNA|nr:unnamed protein product [Rodentolepis nana]
MEDATPNNVLIDPHCELNAAIKQLKCKTSPDEDGIHPDFLIRMGPKAKETIMTLYNKIWETSLVPNQWKKIWETSLVPNQWKVANTSLPQGPQEAVTTCTLFNVLINDIAELVQTVTSMQCHSRIDDLVLWYSATEKNAQEMTDSALNSALKLLANWCDNNGMVINTPKTALQTFSLAHQSINPLLRYKDTTLENIPLLRYKDTNIEKTELLRYKDTTLEKTSKFHHGTRILPYKKPMSSQSRNDV